MIIYLDYVFFINLLFDFILLIGISLVLKRVVSFKRLIFGSITGGMLSFIVFIPVSSFLFFILKMLSGILMILVTFKYKNIRYLLTNFLYLMILSIIVGGMLYFINIALGMEHSGMVFFTNGNGVNIYILIIISFIFIFIYRKVLIQYKSSFTNNYKVKVVFLNKVYLMNGYLDTGNNLCDPFFHKMVFILKNSYKISCDKYIFIPINTVSGSDIMKCFKPSYVEVVGVGVFKDVYIGISNNIFDLNGADIIINNKIRERL